MGRESRANKNTDRALKPMSSRAQRDHLRTTVSDFTRRSLWRHLGFDEKKPVVEQIDDQKEKHGQS